MQTFQIFTFLAALALAAGVRQTTVAELESSNRPVSKVITLLKDMLTQLEKENEEDQEIYDKMACWCETNDKEKATSIADAEDHIKDLTIEIEKLTANSARLNTEIAKLNEEVAHNKAALATATAIREKEVAAFKAEEKDLLSSIQALTEAITVLSKHQGADPTAFLQMPRGNVVSIAATIQRAMHNHASLFEGVFTPDQQKAAAAFVQAPQDYFDAQPTFKQSYAPQSGQIFGILTQMKETFEANLASAQKEEAASQQAYEDLKAAKTKQIEEGQAQIDLKSQELADTDEKNAQAKEDLKDTNATMAADMEFLGMLKEKCAMTDSEWEERQNTRRLEMSACSKALAVLSTDDAHDLVKRTFNPAFVQAATAENSKRRNAASKLLSDVAQKIRNPRLSALAVQVKLDAFTKVKKAIDNMIAQLLLEKADEIKHKDFCTDELDQNRLQTEKKDRQRQDLEARIETLEMLIAKLTKEIDTLKAEITEEQVQLKRVGEDRELANKEFQTTIADQRSTQKLLQAALAILEEFYGKAEAEAAFLQRQEPAGPPPPPGFEAYKKNQASGGVMSMIQQIISDAKAMEAEALKAETDAQSAYESFVKETNASITAKAAEIVNKSESRAKAEIDLAARKQDLENTNIDLEQLANYKAELHTACDYVLKNFDVRQTARDEEVAALRQAKAILSGADFEEFLQHA